MPRSDALRVIEKSPPVGEMVEVAARAGAPVAASATATARDTTITSIR